MQRRLRENPYVPGIAAQTAGRCTHSRRGAVYRAMGEIGLNHKPGRKPNGITKADKEARKSGGLTRRDFTAKKPLGKCATDMAEIKASDGKLHASAIFGCYDLAVLGLAMDTMDCQHFFESFHS